MTKSKKLKFEFTLPHRQVGGLMCYKYQDILELCKAMTIQNATIMERLERFSFFH
jgi:hypothetical protein